VELPENTITRVDLEDLGKKNAKIDCNPRSYFACAKCRSISRNIETFRRADGKVLQLLTCTECDYKWKEIWLRATNPNN
jgi:DNA-directed RNA polymerase subunit M/transcription elongation factor TFIIS